MFKSFFPNPKPFFLSAAAYAFVAVLFWFFVWKGLGVSLGWGLQPGEQAVIGVSVFWSKPFLWFYLYYIIVTAIFATVWWFIHPHKYFLWSVLGSALIIFTTYYQVEVSVAINAWYGPFYDLIQASAAKTRPTPMSEYIEQLWIFMTIASMAVIIGTLTRFFVSHYNFRWRQAMNDFYMDHWQRLRGVEGASQRVQDDTMRFTSTLEGLGVSFIDAIMTLIAFLPVLHALESNITDLPIIGAIPYPLVTAAILWSLFGTGLMAAIGIKLPGLEFRNQRVEATYRKELVYGEDDPNRASRRRWRNCSSRCGRTISHFISITSISTSAASSTCRPTTSSDHRAAAHPCRPEDHAGPDDADPELLRSGALVLPVPDQFLAHDHLAHLHLQASPRLRGDAGGQGSRRHRARGRHPGTG